MHTERQLEKLSPKTHTEGGYTIVYNCQYYSIDKDGENIARCVEEYWHDPHTMLERARIKVGLSTIKDVDNG
jgi:hypothetical protein